MLTIIISLVIAAIASYATVKQYRREHPAIVRQPNAPPARSAVAPKDNGKQEISPKTMIHPDGGHIPARRSISPIDELTRLGWVVTVDAKRGKRFTFQDASRPLPDMHRSAAYFREIDDQFTVSLLSVRSLNGLAALRGIRNLTGLSVAAPVSDLTEVGALDSVTNADFNGITTRDVAPLARLTRLRKLSLIDVRFVTELSPLVTLTALTDVSALTRVATISSLDLTGTHVADMSPLINMNRLSNLTISGNLSTSLSNLRGGHIKTLHIHDYNVNAIVDLTAVGTMTSLELLEVYAPRTLDLYPIRGLDKLRNLIIVGSNISFPPIDSSIQVQNVNVVGHLRGLRALTLAWVLISDLDFLSDLKNLEELRINWVPVNDVHIIGSLNSLRLVGLVGVPVVDISPLLKLNRLQEAIIQKSPARSDTVTELERRGVIVRR
jgi:Leucine-rich repeat (LRR) protein